jgi:hypothetical protein
MKRAKVRELVADVLDARDALPERPITVRTLTVDFEKRTVSVDGRVYGPIETAGFSIPLLDSTYVVMPSRSTEPW